MTRTEIKLERCPCCGGEARAQFEVYGTWVRVFCVKCGLSTMSVPTHNYDPTPAAELWSARPIEDALNKRIAECENALISMVQQFFYSKDDENIFRHSFMSAEEEAAEYLVEHGIARWAGKNKSSIYFNEVQE